MIQTISNKMTARIAGLLYLIVVLTGFLSLMYVPNKLIVWDDALLTYQNITASETLFRLGIISGLANYLFLLILSLVLYKLLKEVNANLSKLMVIFVLLSVSIFFVNVQNQLTVLSLINSNIFSAEQIHTQVLFHLDQFESRMSIVHIFSGLWLLPLGYLVFKSKFLPKLIGVILILGCFGYLMDFAGHTLIKSYSKMGLSLFAIIPSAIGEIGLCLWLLIMGVKQHKTV